MEQILNTQRGRITSIDIAKALGMLTIIWGHIRLGADSTVFVYAFHIPLYFFLSGLVFNRDRYSGFKQFFIKRVKSLLIPYFIFSFLTWVVWALFSYVTHAQVDSYWMPLAQTVIAQGSGGFLVHNVPLWFVTCLFGIEILYYFISALKPMCCLIITFAMASISYLLITYCHTVDITLLPWNIEVVCLGIPIYAVGHFVAQKMDLLTIQSWISGRKLLGVGIAILCAVIVYFGSQYNGGVSFGHSDLGKNFFVAYSCAFIGTAMVLILSMVIASYANPIVDKLLWFGKNSFDAMVIHNPIKGIVCVFVGMLFQCSSTVVSHNDFYSTIAFFISLAMTIVGMLFINKVKGLFK